MKNNSYNEVMKIVGISAFTAVIVFFLLAQLFGSPLLSPYPGRFNVEPHALNAMMCKADDVCEVNSLNVQGSSSKPPEIALENLAGEEVKIVPVLGSEGGPPSLGIMGDLILEGLNAERIVSVGDISTSSIEIGSLINSDSLVVCEGDATEVYGHLVTITLVSSTEVIVNVDGVDSRVLHEGDPPAIFSHGSFSVAVSSIDGSCVTFFVGVATHTTIDSNGILSGSLAGQGPDDHAYVCVDGFGKIYRSDEPCDGEGGGSQCANLYSPPGLFNDFEIKSTGITFTVLPFSDTYVDELTVPGCGSLGDTPVYMRGGLPNQLTVECSLNVGECFQADQGTFRYTVQGNTYNKAFSMQGNVEA